MDCGMFALAVVVSIAHEDCVRRDDTVRRARGNCGGGSVTARAGLTTQHMSCQPVQ